MFTVLTVAATYLFRITRYMVQGIDPWSVFQFSSLVLPTTMVKTFAMAMLLAGLLAFGRLSSDSEIVALRANGASLFRMMMPVAGFSLTVGLVAFGINEWLVPRATVARVALENRIAKTLDASAFQDASYPIKKDGKLVAYVTAKDFDLRSRTLRHVTATIYGTDGQPSTFLVADEFEYDGAQFLESGTGWRIRGRAKLLAADGSYLTELQEGAWPPNLPRFGFTPEDIFARREMDEDSMSMGQMRRQIEAARRDRDVTPPDLANMEYGYWNKIALPLAALVYGLLAAPLGIRNHRTGTATGFALSIAIIFCYYALINVMNLCAMGGMIPPYAASFTPNLIGLLVAGVILWRRNT